MPHGEIRAILGANGAGKSSTIKAILGLLKARAGKIEFDGQPILGLPTHRIHRLGIAWVPEGRQLFPASHTTDIIRPSAVKVARPNAFPP